ncbi:DENN (AEX-3) domain containing protein [Nitzschia inconspicua]|uniref:DENN (AEX-3) domain containing protein n=1 Tax=Nitzschia inconspicua TaxID=303405 RepID=A0A9K3LJP8_9STRA|nr:DENN (AEX-3) domain containing protein [Nitzschia inconspicua]
MNRFPTNPSIQKRNDTSHPSSSSSNNNVGTSNSLSGRKSSPDNAFKRTRSSNSVSSHNTATGRGGGGVSNNKTLISLRSTAENRSCCDCRAALVDPSNVYASFCPSDAFIFEREESTRSSNHNASPSANKNNDTGRRPVGISLHDFHFTHRSFAPPDTGTSATGTTRDDDASHSSRSNNSNRSAIIRKRYRQDNDQDIGIHANERLGGFGVFICAGCAQAHRQMGTNVTKVLPVIDMSSWTADSVDWMAQSGGNARCWRIYEAYVTDTWKHRRPLSSSTLSDRLLFCRAKYEALAFCLPPPGPLAESAWETILEHNSLAKKYATSTDLKNIINLSASSSVPGNDKSKLGSKSSLPNRLVDHFCVVSSSMQILPGLLKKDLSKLSSPEELFFWPHVSDCYPEQEFYRDMEFPEHLPTFVMPKGCHPVSQPKPPCFYSFVLTMADGERLYGGCLQIYDEHYDLEDLRQTIEDSDYTGDLPAFLEATEEDSDDASSDVLFLPKCLILLSHHAFFDLFRSVLLELYQISLTAAPLPIERYIANFVREVPLPPRGRVKVEFAFTSGRKFTIQRPPANQLPMTDFPYRPLFASLSVSNIIVVLASLMEERKVVFLSHHCSILTPVAEAMVSALFPFQWVGLYIPLMPLSMLDILDAPVPYLVGVDADYFQKVPVKNRPKDALLVDLDRDVLHMGALEIPKVPPRDAEKLLLALEEAGGAAYLVPNSGIKGCIMTGTETSMLVPNEDRPRYAHMTTMKALDAECLGRQEVFATTDLAYGGTAGNSATISGFGTEHGQMTMTTDSSHAKEKKSGKVFGISPMKKPKFMRNKKAEILSNSEFSKAHSHLLDMGGAAAISSGNIRSAFLRFTVTLVSEYKDLISTGPSRRFFNDATGKNLLADLGLESGSTLFLQNVLDTQFFQHFLEERKSNPESPEIKFFEESMIAKLNRSKKATMANGGKKRPTPFLNDETWKVTKTYAPPPPSNLGLPDSNDTYTYGTFPTLDPSRFGRIRSPTSWRQSDSTRFKFAKKSSNVSKTERDIVKMALRPILSAPTAVFAAAARSARDLDSALMAISVAAGLREKSNDRLSGEKCKKEAVEKRTVNTLSKADMIVINARRKNIILLDCIIKMQAICRRTKMWPDFNSTSHNFLRMRLAESELCRLWSMVGYDTTDNRMARDVVALRSEAIGLDSTVYIRCKTCVDWINHAMSLRPQSDKITDALKAEEVERLQAYERLGSLSSDQELAKMYRHFDIPQNEKMKKVALAKKLWTNIGQVDHSVSTMLLLFPELLYSLGINFQPPSAKGQRRFPNASKLPAPSLDQNLWNEISVEGNVKKHVQEVAILYMTKMPAVWKKLNQRSLKEMSGYPISYQRAIQEVYKQPTWQRARRILIKRYLNGRYSYKANPNVEVVLSESFSKGMIYSSLQQTPSDYKNPFDDSPTNSCEHDFVVNEKKID